jgi:hypothetical protein
VEDITIFVINYSLFPSFFIGHPSHLRGSG